MKKVYLCAAYIVFPLIIGIVLGIWQIQAPAVDETSEIFQRMMYNVERFAQKPRTNNVNVGSDELERVRSLIIAEIENIGITPILQNSVATPEDVRNARSRIRGSGIPGGITNLPDDFFVQNIFVKLESSNSDKGILFIAHYDSAPNSPGAADAMIGVCAMLEVLRLFANHNNLENNIYFLFTDAEEAAAVGALAFLNEYNEVKYKIDMVVNLEAQGNKGGLIIFRTSPQAYSILNIYRKAVSRPIGFSVGEMVFLALRTYTDFDFFLQYGWNGIDTAVLEGREHYHQMTDNFENLSRTSAWHYLTTAFELADYFANNSLDLLSGQSSGVIFFPFLPGYMILLKYIWAYILCIAACGLAFGFLIYEYKNKRLKISFANIFMLFLIMFSIVCIFFFHAGSYLFWIPLLLITITAFLKKWEIGYRIGQIASRIIILILWVPVVYLLFVLTLVFIPLPARLLIIFLPLAFYFFFCLIGLDRKEYR